MFDSKQLLPLTAWWGSSTIPFLFYLLSSCTGPLKSNLKNFSLSLSSYFFQVFADKSIDTTKKRVGLLYLVHCFVVVYI